MGGASASPTLLVVGPVPPPAFGVAEATQLMLGSPVLAARFRIVHLDTSDTRDLANLGRLDLRNVYLGIKHLGQLAALLAKERPDVTLLTVSQGRLGLVRDALFVLVGRTLGTRLVVYLRGSGYADMRARQGWIADRVLRFILGASSRVIVLSESLRGMAHAVYPNAKVAVVSNGCPRAVRADEVGIRDERRPVLLYLGRISRAKGVDDAVRAAREVAASIPTLEFVLCGEWDSQAYREEVLFAVERSGLSNTVRFFGPRSGAEKATLFARAWVLVMPSHSEGQPWVILEAMSAGVPVVATDTGAVAETVQDGASGFVVPVGDSEALADRVIALLQDEGLWRRMSGESVRRYHEHFTVERSHTALADVLEQVVRDG